MAQNSQALLALVFEYEKIVRFLTNSLSTTRSELENLKSVHATTLEALHNEQTITLQTNEKFSREQELVSQLELQLSTCHNLYTSALKMCENEKTSRCRLLDCLSEVGNLQ